MLWILMLWKLRYVLVRVPVAILPRASICSISTEVVMCTPVGQGTIFKIDARRVCMLRARPQMVGQKSKELLAVFKKADKKGGDLRAVWDALKEAPCSCRR